MAAVIAVCELSMRPRRGGKTAQKRRRSKNCTFHPARSNLNCNTEARSEDLGRGSVTKALAGAVVQEILGTL